MTEAALRWMGIDPRREGLVAREDRYDHLGPVRYFVRELGEPAALTA
jgi:hypothetical protein